MGDGIEHRLFLHNLEKILNNKKIKQDFDIIDCIKNSFTITTTLILIFMVFPRIMGFSFSVIEPRSNSMKDSLGNVGFGYYKNYKSPIFASTGSGEYLSGEASYVYFNNSIVKEEIEVGDVVIFNRAGVDVVHQVIEKYNHSVITKGTNNVHDDGFIDYENIKGKMVFWVRIF